MKNAMLFTFNCPRRLLALLFLPALAAGCNSRPAAPPGSVIPATAKPAPTATAAAAPAESRIRFADITEQAGIRFLHQSAKTDRKYMIETMGSGCAFLDYDGDGKQDILLLNNAPLTGGKVEGRPMMKLFRNAGDGKFQDVTERAGLGKEMLYAMGAAVGDYDNDGRQDLYVTCVLGASRLYRNTGGKFQDVTERAGVGNKGRWGTSCAWLDYDKDGRLDLFVGNYVKYASLKDDQPCYAGGEKHRIYCIPAAYESAVCTLYRNAGGGKFQDVSAETGIGAAKGKALGVSVWDYDRDGWLDLFVACDTTPGLLFHNEGGKTFREVGVEAGIAYDDDGNAHSGMGIDAADLMNDGKTFLTLTNYQGQETSFYSQVSPELFVDKRHDSGIGAVTGKYLGFGALFLDADNDGWKDMLQVNGHVQDDIERREPETHYAQATLLFRNLGNGQFPEVGRQSGEPFTKEIVGRGLAWGDIDDDGRQDALISTNNGHALLWRNVSDNKHHWLKLKLEGTKSNRDGIGALVLVTAGGKTQRALVRSGSSYMSQSDLRPNFGLGDAATADIEIRWPSGQVDRFSGIAADKIYTAREGAGALQAP